MNFLRLLIVFVITFTIIGLIYYFFIIKRCKKNKDYVPVEVSLIISLHQIDYKKIDLYKMIKVVSLITTLILAVIITIISTFFDNNIIVLLFGTALSVLVAIICYNYLGRYYKKKSINVKKHK